MCIKHHPKKHRFLAHKMASLHAPSLPSPFINHISTSTVIHAEGRSMVGLGGVVNYEYGAVYERVEDR